ncbi:MAG: VOC family protein [Anaerolineales bacterium]|nr:VOC family protein [Anaerolineales bacterium]
MNNLLSQADQVGIIVSDLDAFLESMKELLGLDGFEIIEYPPEDIDPETSYYGQPNEFKVKMAFRDFGNFQLEVVEPLEGQSVFHDFLENHGPGLHHIRFTEEDLDTITEKLKEQGIQQIASGKGAHGSSKWAYFDTAEALQGLYIEIRKPKF